jgi:O-antigen ligase
MINELKKYLDFNNLPFLLLQIYLFVYFYQPAERYPALQAFKLEFVLAALTIVAIIFTGKQIKFQKIDFIILTFFLVIILSSLFSIWLSHSFETIYQMFKLFIMYFMISVTVDEEWKLKHMIYFFMFLLFIILWEPFYMALHGEFLAVGEGGIRRAGGVTDIASHPNTLGGIAATTLPFIVFLFRMKLNWKAKIIATIFLIVTLGIVKYSESRAAMLTVLFFGLILFFVSKHKFAILVGVVALVIFSWIFILDQQTKERFLSLGQIDTALEAQSAEERVGASSISTRLQIYLDGLQLFASRPILGYGADSFSTARGRRFGRWQNAHNLYIQCLVDVGLIGFIVFMYLLITLAKMNLEIYKFSRNDPDRFEFYEFLSLAVLSYLILRMFNGMFGHSLYIYYWWIVAGITKTQYFLFGETYQKYLIEKEQQE